MRRGIAGDDAYNGNALIISGPISSGGGGHALHYKRHAEDCLTVKRFGLRHVTERISTLKVVDCKTCLGPKPPKAHDRAPKSKHKPRVVIKKGTKRHKVAAVQKEPKTYFPKTATKENVGRVPKTKIFELMRKRRPDLFSAYEEANFLVKPLILEQFKDDCTMQIGYDERLYGVNNNGEEFTKELEL